MDRWGAGSEGLAGFSLNFLAHFSLGALEGGVFVAISNARLMQPR